MRNESASDGRIAVIAAGQHGVITTAQALACGLSPAGITRRVASGRLHRVHPAVYAVGHIGLSNEGKWMAAVLTCGPGTALSHRSAAELWTLLTPTGGLLHVTVPTDAGREQRSGLILHRSPSLQKAATTIKNGIGVTTVPRTLRDLRPAIPAWELRRATRQAEFLGLPTGLETDRTRSDPEADFLRLCRRYRTPNPEVNQKIGRFTVDFLWREQRLIVETDAWSTHRGAQAFEHDRPCSTACLARVARAGRSRDR